MTPLPEPVEVRGVCGKMAVQPPGQVQFAVRSLNQSKGRLCSEIAVQSPSQVQLGLRSLSQTKCAVVQCDGGAVTGSS